MRASRWLPLGIAGLLQSCAISPAADKVRRVPWSSVTELLNAVASWPLATSTEAPWAIEVLVPDDLSESDFVMIHDAFRSRGYQASHASPSVVGEVTKFMVRLALADPVELRIETRSVAETLWLAAIPFGTTGGNSLWLILPRRAIPAARAALAGVVPDSAWREW